ncbi:probable amidase At4g34880 [Hibiscus syriacus]|uniref:probable amidase At4g34880 n=1 Tax=Hibiscus syriacus TaxID=106335 RepID=UPI001921170C|nr:probable amidase At4g34880 [Hibiscus syriacus]
MGLWDNAGKKIKEYGRKHFLDSEDTKGIGKEKEAILKLAKMSRDGFEKLMRAQARHVVVAFFIDFFYTCEGSIPWYYCPGRIQYGRATFRPLFRGIKGCRPDPDNTAGLPFGLCFGGLKGADPTLVEIAYAFEQATKIRKPPSFEH